MKLTRAKVRLLREMANDRRVILIQRHPRGWVKLRYTINSFPIRHLHTTTVAYLLKYGYLQTTDRGYLELTTKGMLVASLQKERARS